LGRDSSKSFKSRGYIFGRIAETAILAFAVANPAPIKAEDWKARAGNFSGEMGLTRIGT